MKSATALLVQKQNSCWGGGHYLSVGQSHLFDNPQLDMEHARMNAQTLCETAKTLVADDKGVLAIDESNGTCHERFAQLAIAPTEENRRAYRELLISTPGLGENISGVILHDETIRQSTRSGVRFIDILARAGIIAGIKVDTGAKDLAGHSGEKVTEGLDSLRDRLAEYAAMGARFAKWRAVITIGTGIPTRTCIEANMQSLARYAALCQEAQLVPIVEPEVLMQGDHSLLRCSEVTEDVLRTLFAQLYRHRVLLEGIVLKPNMVLAGLDHPRQPAVDEVASATVQCLLRSVPTGNPAVERHECPIQTDTALGPFVLFRACVAANGVGNLARRQRQ